MPSRHLALSVDRSGVPGLEADIATTLFTQQEQQQQRRFYVASYYDVAHLAPVCRATKRDVLSEMGLRQSNVSAGVSSTLVFLPRSPFAATCTTNYPSADAGPCGDQLQGRVSMTLERWSETVAATRPDLSAPVCDLASIPEILGAFPAAQRKKNTFSARNQKWIAATLDKYAAAAAAAASAGDAPSAYLPQLVFPIGVQFAVEQKKTSNNNSNAVNADGEVDAAAAVASGGSDDADEATIVASSGVVIDAALFAQWSALAAQRGERQRVVALLNLGCGETRQQRHAFLQELAGSLRSAQEAATAASSAAPLPPLSFVVGSICDKDTVLDFEEIFAEFLGSGSVAAADVVYSCALVPHTMASRGLALQRWRDAGAAGNAAGVASAATAAAAAAETQRRNRDGDDGNTTRTAAATVMPASAPREFNVINLWDPAFKFSRAPLFCATREGDAAASSESGGFAPCACMACQRHTAGYFHHLLDVHEMNGEILLTLHNWSLWREYLMN